MLWAYLFYLVYISSESQKFITQKGFEPEV